MVESISVSGAEENAREIEVTAESMETMQDSGGLRVDGSKGGVASGLPSSKTVNQLRIVESGDESGKMVIPTKSEMDPYKELELYLAKVNVSLFAKKFLRFLSCLVTMLMNETS